MQKLTIQIPKGYTIDEENSTSEKIVFKRINSIFDIKEITEHSFSMNNKAKALAQLSQVLPYYDTVINWDNNKDIIFIIKRVGMDIIISETRMEYSPFAFKSFEEAERFLYYNNSILSTYFELYEYNLEKKTVKQ